VGERGPGPPETVPSGLRRIDAGAEDLSRARRGAANAGRGAEHHRERGHEFVDARRDTRSDVVDAVVLAPERREYGLDDIRDVNVVPLVAAIAVHGDRLAAPPAADEDRDDAALEILTLARAVDIREAERDRGDAARGHEALGFGLEPAVVRHGSRRSRLRGALRGLAVDRPARRDVHERARAERLRE